MDMHPPLGLPATPRRSGGDCPDFCVNKNGTVPFSPIYAMPDRPDTKILTGPIGLVTTAGLNPISIPAEEKPIYR